MIPKEKESLAKQAYSQIKEMILTRKLTPGLIFNEAQLQELLGIGRTPIREAILKLSNENLVTIHPRRGIEIAKISPKRIHDLFEIRSLIEPSLLEMGYSNLDKKWLQEVRGEFERYNDILEQGFTPKDTIDISELDNSFHLTLSSAMGNSFVTELLSSFSDYLTLFRASTPINEIRFGPSNQEHLDIIDSLLAEDLPKASQLLKEHLERSYQEAVNVVMQMNF